MSTERGTWSVPRRWTIFLLLSVCPAGAFAADTAKWFQHNRMTTAGQQLIGELKRAADRGLLVADYDGVGLEQRIHAVIDASDARRPGDIASLDAALSAAAARIASDLHEGRVKPAAVGYDLDVPRPHFDVQAAVDSLAGSRDVGATLDSMEPQLRHYALLKQALATYRKIALENVGITILPAPPRARVRPGEAYAGAPALRRLLTALGDLRDQGGDNGYEGDHGGAEAGATYLTLDVTLVGALKRFQSRHGLDADGVLGRATFHALTTPMSARVQQIELSLERVRWLPPRLDFPPIIVNIPQFRLFAFRTTQDYAQDILQMDVIVGAAFKGRHTPVFAADMKYVVLQPYWDVPRSILVKELLRDIRAQPGWIEKNRYEIVRGDSDASPAVPATAENIELLARGQLRLRQKPGPTNALGRVKFMFPNAHNVYLHDTPTRALFNRSRRAFSHGCIRVSDPMALLAHVMRDEPGWSEARRDSALEGDKPVRVALSKPIRVFILYGTALATEAGPVQFFDDLYGQDAPLIAKLAAR